MSSIIENQITVDLKNNLPNVFITQPENTKTETNDACCYNATTCFNINDKLNCCKDFNKIFKSGGYCFLGDELHPPSCFCRNAESACIKLTILSICFVMTGVPYMLCFNTI